MKVCSAKVAGPLQTGSSRLIGFTFPPYPYFFSLSTSLTSPTHSFSSLLSFQSLFQKHQSVPKVNSKAVRPVNFSDLVSNVRSCSLCAPQLPAGPRPVFQIAPSAKILVAGQAPGRRVHETGIPFDDPSGDRLRLWMGVDRTTFYDETRIAILPMGFCYPGTGKSGDLPPRPECAPAWRQRLLDQLPEIQITLLVGQYAHAWHLGNQVGDSLTETVMAWRRFQPFLWPMPHPSPRNNLWLKKNPWFENEVLPPLRAQIASVLNTGSSP